MSDKLDFTPIRTYTFSHEGAVEQSALTAAGIECYLKDEMTVQADPLLSNAVGGVKLMVHQKDVDRALALLTKNGKTNDEPEENLIATSEECPYCHSGDVAPNKIAMRFSWWSILLLGFPVPGMRKEKSYHCYDCYRDFKVEKLN